MEYASLSCSRKHKTKTMKRIFLFAVIFCISITSISSQSFIGVYSDNDGSTSTGSNNRIATDNFGNIINCTSFANSPINIEGTEFPVNGNLSCVLIKRDANHDLIWAKSLSCGGTTLIGDIYIDNSSSIYVCGVFGHASSTTELNSYPNSLAGEIGMSLFVIKYSPSGQVLWSNSAKVGLSGADWYTDAFKIEGNGTDKITIISPIANVGEQALGSFTVNSDLGNMFFAGLNPDGDWQYAKMLEGTSNMYLAINLDYAANNDIFFSLNFKGSIDMGTASILSVPGSSPQDCVFKTDSDGNFIWSIATDASSWWRSDIVCDGNDAVLFGSFGGDVSFGSFDLGPTYYSGYGVKIDNDGNFLWAKKYGESEANFFTACKSETGFYITGKTSPGVSSNIFDAYELVYANTMPESNFSNSINYVLKLDLNGNVINGAVTSFNFDTFNTDEMSFFNGNLYFTGNALDSASFGYYTIAPLVTNSSNYISTFSENNNLISGASFYDFNSNYSFDPDEISYNAYLNINNGSTNSFVFADGDFNIGTGTGAYSLEFLNTPMYYSLNNSIYNVDFGSNFGQISEYNDFILQPIPDQNDLMVDLTIGPAKPGFNGYAYINLKNVGTTSKTGILEFSINHPEIEITSTVPDASLLETDYLEFDYDIEPTEEIVYLVNFYTSAFAELDSDFEAIAKAIDATDLTPDNNVDTLNHQITGSYDPNSKEVNPRGDIYPEFISNNNDLEYIINFQNTGNDTAFTVLLIDTLSNNLDISTFRVLSSSHNLITNIYDNVIWFRFNQINLVDSLTNEELSHGFVKYSIKPFSNLIIGDIIENEAYIYFDYNTPILTNTVSTEIINTVYSGNYNLDNSISIYPNPCNANTFSLTSSEEIESISIENINGQKIFKKDNLNSFDYNVDTKFMSDGIYFVHIRNKEKTSVLKLIISK